MQQADLSIAGLPLTIDARGSGVRLSLPKCHAKFLTSDREERDGLRLQVRAGPLAAVEGWLLMASAPLVWRLWHREGGQLLFESLEQAPPGRHLVIDAGFRSGTLTGDYGDDADGLWPLQEMDIVLYANWLAARGDLILHAAGVAIDGAGFCFPGESRAGKSTLATALAESGAKVLGEDTVILRRINGQFWIFGTPWHTDPSRCSPEGVPLAKLFFPDRKAPPRPVACPPVQGITRLLRTAFVPYYRSEAVPLILDNLAALAEAVPFLTLGYRLGTDVLPLIGAS